MSQPEGVYPRLELGPAPAGRPFVCINMVATIDGKTVTGGRDDHVQDLGSDTDHATMRQIEGACDAVLVGAGSMRATRGMWFPEGVLRVVATASGSVPPDRRFFTDDRERAFVATTSRGAANVPPGLKAIVCGWDSIDWRRLLKELKESHGVQKLLLEGGSEINASVLSEDLVDELFLTLAPKVKLGRDVPTYAGGDPLSRERMLGFHIVSTQIVGNEIFVRYRRDR
jgi:riboflavin biosynthesis pyrimidine reductase